MDFNPIISSCREVFGCDVVLARYDSVASSVVISQIACQVPGKGNGTMCMKYLLKELGRKGIRVVTAMTIPFNTGGVVDTSFENVNRLKMWYESLGFGLVAYHEGKDFIAAEMKMVL